MSGGLVGRVEQLLELAGKARQERISEQARTLMPYFQCTDAQNEFALAAVNLVEPLARDWQRLKRIEETVRAFIERSETAAQNYDHPNYDYINDVEEAKENLVVALAAVSSGEESNDAT